MAKGPIFTFFHIFIKEYIIFLIIESTISQACGVLNTLAYINLDISHLLSNKRCTNIQFIKVTGVLEDLYNNKIVFLLKD